MFSQIKQTDRLFVWYTVPARKHRQTNRLFVVLSVSARQFQHKDRLFVCLTVATRQYEQANRLFLSVCLIVSVRQIGYLFVGLSRPGSTNKKTGYLSVFIKFVRSGYPCGRRCSSGN